MNIEWNRSSMTRFAGEALFVSGCLSYDAACANEASASKQANLLISDKESRFYLTESGIFVLFFDREVQQMDYRGLFVCKKVTQQPT